jgi:capsular polysaccharide biosynthesis protein
MKTPPEFDAASSPFSQEEALDGQNPRERSSGKATGESAQLRLPVRHVIKLSLLGLVITLVGAGVALVVTLLLPPQYAARTELLYRISYESPTGFLREDRSLTTQAVLLESRRVLEPVALANGVSVEQLAEQVDVNVVEGSLIIEVEVRNGDRATGLRFVDAISDQYFEAARVSDQPELRQYFENQLRDIQRRLRELPVPAPERPELAVREVDVQRQLDEIQLGIAEESRAEVVVPPYSVESPVSPRPMLAVAAGALSGLMIALVVIAVLARLPSRAER